MYVVDDITIAVAEEVGTEVASDIATETVPELMSKTASEMQLGNISESSFVESSEIGSDTISINAPESLVEPQNSFSIANSKSDIIGDNVGEIQSSNTLSNNITEIKGDEIGDIFTKENCIDHSEESPRTIKTINDGLAGQKHPDTGIPYVEKEVVTDTGEKIKGVFPQFESEIDIQIPENIQQASDRTQFAECNKQLQEKIANDPEFKSKFTEDQLADIEDGYTPDGYTWHHNEEIGKMQLVDTDIHSQTRHTGGRYIWGGGSENRY